MVVKCREETIAETSFVVDAPRKRVWDLLASVIFQQLPVEQVDIVSFDRFTAVLKWRLGFMSIPLRVEGKVVGTSRPTSYGCIIDAGKGPMRSRLRVLMALDDFGEDKTKVSCVAAREDGSSPIFWLVGRLQRDFAMQSFESIAARLRWLCSE